MWGGKSKKGRSGSGYKICQLEEMGPHSKSYQVQKSDFSGENVTISLLDY